MSKERIIESLEYCRKNQNSNDCENCEYGGRSFLICERLADDILVLLKEKEAVDPILEQDSMVCGVCGHEVIWQKMLGDGIWTDEKLDYCPHCGRAVKW